MPTITAPTLSPTDELHEGWVRDVTELIQEVSAWATEEHWAVSQTSREINEMALGGRYTLPMLEIHVPLDRPRLAPEEKVVIAPVAYNVLNTRGRVDCFAYPTMNRVMLLRTLEGTWIVRTDSGINWPHPWGKATFKELAHALLNDA